MYAVFVFSSIFTFSEIPTPATTKTSFRLVNDLHKAIGTILPQFAPESIRKENIPSTTPTKQQLQNKDLITQALVQYTLYPKFQVTPIKRDNVFDIPKITPMQIQQPNQLQFQVKSQLLEF